MHALYWYNIDSKVEVFKQLLLSADECHIVEKKPMHKGIRSCDDYLNWRLVEQAFRVVSSLKDPPKNPGIRFVVFSFHDVGVGSTDG